jgi:probable F420-dependent oxidoreductase
MKRGREKAMKLDTILWARSFGEAAATAKAAEEMGFDAVWNTESQHEPFMPLAVAATATRRATLGTAVALAFTRSPMVLAYTAWDLQAGSAGRFVLGLGTQVKGHNERRFSVKWEAPGPRLREVILALRAIWDSWQNRTRLNFSGDFYRFSLMTPFFDPGPIPHPKIPIYIAAVNPYMCRLAGELCDGLHVHPFHSVKYLRETMLPNIEAGAAKAGRSRKDVVMASSAFVVTGDTRREMEEAREHMRMQIAFYASTRTYKPVLDVHGWGDICQRLGEKAAAGDWAGMAKEITDEMLDTYATVGSPEEIPAKLKTKYEGLLDRLAFYSPFRPGECDARWRSLVRAFNG